VEVFVEPADMREVPDFEQSGDKQPRDEEQKTKQVKYVLVELNNREGELANHTEEQPKDRVGNDQAGDEKNGDEKGLFFGFGGAGDETERNGDTHNGAGTKRRKGARPENHKYCQKRRFSNQFLNIGNHTSPFITGQLTLWCFRTNKAET